VANLKRGGGGGGEENLSMKQIIVRRDVDKVSLHFLDALH